MSEVSGWKCAPLGTVTDLIMGQSPDSRFYSESEKDLPFLQGCAEFGSRHPSPVIHCSHPKKLAQKGSILFSVRAPVGRLNLADQEYIIGRGLAAIVGTKVDQGYLRHYLEYVESEFQSAAQGSTFTAINSSELGQWPIDYPTSKPEQAKIAEVLSTVDRAIEQTEALIAKQQCIKTGLMQDLLTRGIDEHGNLRSEETHAFKDSPLGRIPVEWEVKPIGQVFRIQLGKMLSKAAKTGKSSFPYLANRNVQWNKVVLSKVDWMDFSKHEREKFSLKHGDVLVCEGGEVGRTGCATNLWVELTIPLFGLII